MPPLRPRSSSTPPPKDDYTRDVISRGAQAVRDRRSARDYGRSNAQAGLGQMLQTGYSGRPDANIYDQWLQQTTPQGYEVQVGQAMDGPYAGFKTEGMLKSAVRGNAENKRRNDQAAFAELLGLADERLGRIDNDYQAALAESGGMQRYDSVDMPDAQPIKRNAPQSQKWGDIAAAFMDRTQSPLDQEDVFGLPDPVSDAGLNRGQAAAAARYTGQAEEQAKVDYQFDDLNPWLAESSDKYLDQAEFAQQAIDTPISHYAAQAGAEYGVDPNVIGGWYPDDSAIGDYRDQRDIESIENYGMPYADYQQALADIEREQAIAEGDQEAALEQQTEDAIFAETGMGATKLATAAGLSSTDELASVIDTEAFYGYRDEIDAARQSNDPDLVAETVASIMQSAAMQDPTLFAVLQALYQDYVPDDTTIYDEL